MKLAELVAKIIADNLLAMADRLDKRIDERVKALPLPRVAGTWGQGVKFEPNELVTRDFALWIATKESIGVAPGSDQGKGYWRLVVRYGPKSATFALDEKTGKLSIAMDDEPAQVIGSIKPALYDLLQQAGILSAEQIRQLEGGT